MEKQAGNRRFRSPEKGRNKERTKRSMEFVYTTTHEHCEICEALKGINLLFLSPEKGAETGKVGLQKPFLSSL